MNNTRLLYMENMGLTTAEAVVVDILEENEKNIVILDQTIFYPQGGGQPYDKGFIESDSGKFIVEEVRFVDGIVKYIGNFENGKFEKGEKVVCKVGEARRNLNSRIHSAGHLVDMAVNALGLDWIPGKGYHFPDGPYVEYGGSLDNADKEKLKIDIENLCNKFISKNILTKVMFMDKEQMKSVCHFVPDYIPEGKPGRVVMYGDFGVPCGGTHVNNLSEIKNMTIRKVKEEKGNIRVGYDVTRV